MTTDRDEGKAAEKAYLARAGSEPWERTKPFAPRGHDMLSEGLPLIHDFAAAIQCLMPEPGDRVLDLAAGSCWVSEWLQRFNVDVVSIDIASDMLQVGRSRLAPGSSLVAGDLESLPFKDQTFHKAVCLHAFHHLPDMPRGLTEVHRVLKRGGRVVFSEPGYRHADAASSTRAVDEFGVREQNIVVADFMTWCRRAGFADVRIKPLAYIVPWFDLDPERWDTWGALARSRRPARAVRKMWLAFLEIFGAAKTGSLFEEALGRDLVRLLRGAMEDHPLIVATKS